MEFDGWIASSWNLLTADIVRRNQVVLSGLKDNSGVILEQYPKGKLFLRQPELLDRSDFCLRRIGNYVTNGQQ
jgi:hypothetical protein